jgi:hypothetical protein
MGWVWFLFLRQKYVPEECAVAGRRTCGSYFFGLTREMNYEIGFDGAVSKKVIRSIYIQRLKLLDCIIIVDVTFQQFNLKPMIVIKNSIKLCVS